MSLLFFLSLRTAEDSMRIIMGNGVSLISPPRAFATSEASVPCSFKHSVFGKFKVARSAPRDPLTPFFLAGACAQPLLVQELSPPDAASLTSTEAAAGTRHAPVPLPGGREPAGPRHGPAGRSPLPPAPSGPRGVSGGHAPAGLLTASRGLLIITGHPQMDGQMDTRRWKSV